MRSMMFLLLAACGAQPNQPVLANAPRPDPGAVAGVAAAAAAAITLASPDSARTPEKRQDEDKKPIKVKEHVSSSALDRLDEAEKAPANASSEPASPAKQPANPTQTDAKAPRDALDFSHP